MALGYPHLVEVMDWRAIVLGDKYATGRKEANFNELILWTYNATPSQLVEF